VVRLLTGPLIWLCRSLFRLGPTETNNLEAFSYVFWFSCWNTMCDNLPVDWSEFLFPATLTLCVSDCVYGCMFWLLNLCSMSLFVCDLHSRRQTWSFSYPFSKSFLKPGGCLNSQVKTKSNKLSRCLFLQVGLVPARLSPLPPPLSRSHREKRGIGRRRRRGKQWLESWQTLNPGWSSWAFRNTTCGCCRGSK
jgi:hypothetical protein